MNISTTSLEKIDPRTGWQAKNAAAEVKKATSYRYDADGVPIIDREAIEDKAEEFIAFFNPEVLQKPTLTPLAEICITIREKFGIQFSFEQDLGISPRNKKILGHFTFKPRVVCVDRSLDFKSPKWLFTLAHELGHFVFHRNLKLNPKILIPADTDETIWEKIRVPRTALEWLEWHANKFASSLLLPRRTIRTAVDGYLREQGSSKTSFGVIYVDYQECNLQNLSACLSKLHLIYQASRTTIECRLKELGIVIDVRNQNVSRIGKLLRET